MKAIHAFLFVFLISSSTAHAIRLFHKFNTWSSSSPSNTRHRLVRHNRNEPEKRSERNKRCTLQAPVQDTASTPPSNGTTSSGGVINVPTTDACGPIGATTDITAVSGPNGNIDWLNCGIEGSGWTPPKVQISDIIAVDLTTALNDPNSPFQACSQYVSIFEKYAQQYGLPAILLTSFAMQESSCNPQAIGGAGEQGIMQITQDKCGGAPDGNCLDVDFNIGAGAQFFSDTLNGNGGDLLVSLGAYNGWQPGMTVASATAAAGTSCCRCQNNLDYLDQFLNGWCQNVDPYTHDPPLGKYFNLNQCGSS